MEESINTCISCTEVESRRRGYAICKRDGAIPPAQSALVSDMWSIMFVVLCKVMNFWEFAFTCTQILSMHVLNFMKWLVIQPPKIGAPT